MKHLWLCVALVGLSACGAGGVETGNGVLSFSSFDALGDYTLGLTERADQLSTTPAQSVPTTETARYQGELTLLLDDPVIADGVVGSAVFDVSFANDSFTGEAGNFFTLDENRTPGAIRFVDGEIVRGEEEVLAAEVSGLVAFLGGSRVVEGRMSGKFLGPSAEVLVGSVTAEGTVDGRPPIALVGALVAEQ